MKTRATTRDRTGLENLGGGGGAPNMEESDAILEKLMELEPLLEVSGSATSGASK